METFEALLLPLWKWLDAFWADQQFAVVGALLVALIAAAFQKITGGWPFRRGRHPGKDFARPINTLPRPTEHYQGDAKLIRRIMETLEKSASASLVGLAGMGGIGKTEAAVVTAWAMLKKGRFRDGALMIDLMGFAEEGEPVGHEDALRRLASMMGASAFGPRPDDVPQTQWVAALSDKWRGMTAARDLLVILDNAKDADHVRPLLPGADGPRVLITSRNAIRLPGQAASIEVARLDAKRAAKLARSLTKAIERPLTEGEVGRLVAVSLGLPLLVETVAGVIAANRALSAADWLTRFEEAGAALAIDDVGKVKARLGVSVDALEGEDGARYAALSLFASGFHAQSACALWDLDEIQGALALGRMSGRSLLIPTESPFEEEFGPRYRLHDYLEVVTAERFSALPQEVRTGFRHRWGREALKLLASADQLYRTKDGDLAGLRLFEQEQATIAAAQDWAARRAGEDDTAAALAMGFPNHSLLMLRLTPRQFVGWLEAGLPAARRLGARHGEATILGNLGHRLRVLGDLDGAETRHKQSLEIETELGNKSGMAQDYGNLGIVYTEQGEYTKAEEAYRASLRTMKELGDETGIANAHGNLGILFGRQERFDIAEAEHLASLKIKEHLGLRGGSANTYGNLGVLYRMQGRLNDAGEAFLKSLKITDELGYRDVSANQRFNLADLRLQQGRIAEAREHAVAARKLRAEMGLDHKVAETDALIAEIDAAAKA